MKKIQKSIQKQLLVWFHRHKRDLPWRQTKDPYKIWISEVMLQQTTSKAVIPYYNRFLKKFPNLKSLSQSTKKQVFSIWSGLGYYNRAENLRKSAQQIQKQKRFPKTFEELILLPGFGPYTSRSVSSLAFQESVGVLDGNVIRFLCRFHNLPIEWWKSSEKKILQQLADLWVQSQNSSHMNQALMEIGSLICLPKQPKCLICPLAKHCQSLKNQKQHELPLSRPKKPQEIWHWRAQVTQRNSKWAFIKNERIPFLKNKIMFPGRIQKCKTKPKKYDFYHTIMNYQIFISVQKLKKQKVKSIQWLTQKQATELNPSSLIRKILSHSNESSSNL